MGVLLDAGLAVAGDVPSRRAALDEATPEDAGDRVDVRDGGAVSSDIAAGEEDVVGDSVGVEGLESGVGTVGGGGEGGAATAWQGGEKGRDREEFSDERGRFDAKKREGEDVQDSRPEEERESKKTVSFDSRKKGKKGGEDCRRTRKDIEALEPGSERVLVSVGLSEGLAPLVASSVLSRACNFGSSVGGRPLDGGGLGAGSGLAGAVAEVGLGRGAGALRDSVLVDDELEGVGALERRKRVRGREAREETRGSARRSIRHSNTRLSTTDSNERREGG